MGPAHREREVWRGAAAALAVFGLWMGLTYLLEGAQHTLLRPEATALRATYTWVANYAVGLGLSIAALRWALPARARTGFGGLARTLVSVAIGTALGAGAYLALGGATTQPVVLANLYAQVLGVSLAEVVVCWALLGSAVGGLFAAPRGPRALAMAVVVCSASFGVYHFAHSPPFDQPAMVARLSVVGVGTGLFFFASRDVYGTLALHNWLGVLGVSRSLHAAGKLDSYAEPRLALLATAVAGVALLASLHAGLLRASSSGVGPARRSQGKARVLYDLLVGGADVASCVLAAPLLRRWYNGWGSSEAERAETLPGDALVPAPKLGYTRAITIDAPPEAVWRWLVQFGQGRGGFYSYDALENLVGCQIHSADRILPEHQQLARGDLIRSNPGEQASWQVIDVEPPHHLVLMGADPETRKAPPVLETIPARGYAASTWQWVLRPLPEGKTRLIVRQRLTYSPSQRLLWHVVEPFNFAMERRMLRGLARRAERSDSGPPQRHVGVGDRVDETSAA